MVKGFKLKMPHEDGSIEAFLSEPQTEIESNKTTRSRQKIYPNKKQIRQNYKLLQKIKTNPKAYFNFGFKTRDYALFMTKQFFMRLEKSIIHVRLRRMDKFTK